MEDVAAHIIAQAQGGDHAAFRTIAQTYSPRLQSVIRRLIRDYETEQDILQDVLTKAYIQLPRFRGDSSLGTWLHRIAYTTCLNHLRSVRRAPQHEVINEEEVAVLSPSMFDEMDGELIRSVLQSELEKLSPLYAVVVDLFYIQELRYEDIVRVTGMPMGTVKARLSRARNMLRDAVLSKLGEK